VRTALVLGFGRTGQAWCPSTVHRLRARREATAFTTASNHLASHSVRVKRTPHSRRNDMIRQTITAIAVSMVLASPMFAGQARTAETEALQKADRRLAEAEQGAGKPARAASARQQRQQVQDLLDQLEAGKNVDPAAVDRVLRQAEYPY